MAGPARRTPRELSATDAVRVPPHSVEAEQAVLGGLMLDNSGWDAVADRISAEDFYRADHQRIFAAKQCAVVHLFNQFTVLNQAECSRRVGVTTLRCNRAGKNQQTC